MEHYLFPDIRRGLCQNLIINIAIDVSQDQNHRSKIKDIYPVEGIYDEFPNMRFRKTQHTVKFNSILPRSFSVVLGGHA